MTDAAQAENPRAVIGGNNPPLGEVLADRYAPVLAEISLLADQANALPAKVDSDTAQANVGKVVIAARNLRDKLETNRRQEKEPFLTSGRIVDGYFGEHTERLENMMARLQARADAYAERKAAEAAALLAEQRRAQEELAAQQERLAAKARERGRPNDAAKREDAAEAARDEADRLAEQHETAKPADLVRSRVGGVTASAKGKWSGVVEDWETLDLNQLRPWIPREVIQKAIDQVARTHKAQANLKGVKVTQETRAIFK